MPKQDCIMDACSYIYLQRYKFLKGGKDFTPFDLLKKHVNIKHHSVISDEIKRTKRRYNEKLLKREAVQINNREYKLSKHTLEYYDKILYDNAITNATTGKDKGEKVNLISAIDSLLKKKTIPIYLSDDIKAIKEKELFNSFLLYNIWTSFDAVVYLFLVSDEIYYKDAKNAITDLTNFLHQPTYKNYCNSKEKELKSNPENRKEIQNKYSEKIRVWTEKTQKRKMEYLSRLELINKLKSN